MALTLKNETAPETKAVETPAVETKAVETATATEPVVNSENVGKDSDKIEFIAALGDPSQDDVTTLADGTKRVDPTIVGYRFKATIDLDVPDCPPGDDFKKNAMSFTNLGNTRHVKAGETFDLTKFEMGCLLSDERFNGEVLGGKIPCVVTYTGLNKKNSEGGVVKTASSAVPTTSLRAKVASQSVKDPKMINVLTFTTEKLANGQNRKTRTIVKGFEKWAPLCIERATTRTTSGAPTSRRNKNAAAFLAIVNAKKA